ncbi:unnamed protein product [Candidula unifasciata]|uniref:Calx-beta domain-containing protein n=1 Tax=Candidula unifasciata TaxID=100452 RepID=A0A8S3Z1C6_9EUPU|nr:unnamed protein product [Candidula unifasciata]
MDIILGINISGSPGTLPSINVSGEANETSTTPGDTDNYIDLNPDEDQKLDSCPTIRGLCKENLLVPMWRLELDTTDDDRYFRAILYVIALIYLFIGLSVITERLMTAVDVIVSKKKQIAVMISDGTIVYVTDRLWSETLANVTIVALGSSASEILLTIVEVYSNDFQVGSLGPSAIIGSAAYNLFIISAICMFAVPVDKAQKITKGRVFLVTAAWSVFAYIWLFIILFVISKGVIEIWEAVLTCLFFPGSVYTAYLADKNVEVGKCMGRQYCGSEEVTKESQGKSMESVTDSRVGNVEAKNSNLLLAAEQQRNEIALMISKLRETNPHLSLTAVAAMAKKQIMNKEPKSKAFYRAAKKINSWPQIMKETESCTAITEEEYDFNVTKVFFESDTYSAMEDAGMVRLMVLRKNGDINKVCRVDYYTEDGTAKNILNYAAARGSIIFKPLQTKAQINIALKSGNRIHEDEYFYVRLSNPKLRDIHENELVTDTRRASRRPSISSDSASVDFRHIPFQMPETDVSLYPPYVATVTLVDANHPGIFYFPNTTLIVEENCGDIPVKVCRAKGGKGRIKLPYHPVNGTAELGEDFKIFGSELIFENHEYEKNIMMRISNKERYLVRQYFYLALDEPEVAIHDLDDGDYRYIDIQLPTNTEYAFHFLALVWKLLAALVPPTTYCMGWASFFACLLELGILTAIIVDLASSLGCTIGVQDSFIGISFVAIGISLPETFSSKMAVFNEANADAAIGNVPACSAANIFVGLGIAWIMAATQQGIQGTELFVLSDHLASFAILFSILSFLAISVLFARRRQPIGGELGGPIVQRILTSLILITLWVVYLILSLLIVFCVIVIF